MSSPEQRRAETERMLAVVEKERDDEQTRADQEQARADRAESKLAKAETKEAGVRVIAESAIKMRGRIDPTVLLSLLDEEESP